MNKIDLFQGQYFFLSNFYPCQIEYEGIIYPSSEHAFHAAKTDDLNFKVKLSSSPEDGNVLSSGDSKWYGRKVKLKRNGKSLSKEEWDLIKDDIMYDILKVKFNYPMLKKMLLETGDIELIEGNTWNDIYWGVCNGIGQNKLGKILMKIREEIRNEVNKNEL